MSVKVMLIKAALAKLVLLTIVSCISCEAGTPKVGEPHYFQANNSSYGIKTQKVNLIYIEK